MAHSAFGNPFNVVRQVWRTLWCGLCGSHAEKSVKLLNYDYFTDWTVRLASMGNTIAISGILHDRSSCSAEATVILK